MLSLLLLALSSTSALAKNAKRGISFISVDNEPDVMNLNQSSSEISWIYDWATPVTPNLASTGIEFVPMQWGAGNIENLSTIIKAQGSKVLLGFNEPDFSQQSNIDPNYAAQLWTKYIEPLKASGVRLGAPAVSSGAGGIPWLTSFMSACSNCTFDFIPVHWYGTGVAGFYDYLWQIHSRFGNRTLWVTEYASTSLNATEVEDFLNQTTVYLDGLDWVERYAWFGYFRPENGSAYNMLEADGGLNNLGKHYVGADTVVRTGPITNTAAGPAGNAGPTKPLATATSGPDSKPSFLPGNYASPRWDLPSKCAFVYHMLEDFVDAYRYRSFYSDRKAVQLFKGSFVHCPRLGQLEILNDQLLVVDDSGFITHFELTDTAESRRYLDKYPESLTVLEPGSFLLPTFCDLHLHAPQFLYQGNGLHLPLMKWLDEYAFKAEERLDADPVLARKVYSQLAKRLIEHGTGAVMLFGTIREETNLILAEALLAAGLRGFVGKLSMDVSTRPSYVESSTEESLASIERFTEKMKDMVSHLSVEKRMVEPVLTPRFVPTCTDALLQGLGNLAQERSLRIQSHLAEAHDQVEWVRSERGIEDIEVFEKHNLLTSRTVQAHCTFLDIPSLDKVRDHGTAIAHCPLSNAYFSAEPFRLREALAEGVRVGLGTDIAGGYSIDIMNAMRQAVVVSRMREGARTMGNISSQVNLAIDWKEALYLATRGGAEALALPEGCGTFQVGAPLDAQQIELFKVNPTRGMGPFDVLGLEIDDSGPNSLSEDMVEKWWCIGDSRNRTAIWVQGVRLAGFPLQ
ncbi:hypothetical protein V5O48_000861 [Marasmius crinis-equi]|uniref:Amidohydrolase-related domain-containing protein n=1 Tax=Marasmius crinis-equi TaxID=585013 RepID=A0ABR3G0L5_9AGAR